MNQIGVQVLIAYNSLKNAVIRSDVNILLGSGRLGELMDRALLGEV